MKINQMSKFLIEFLFDGCYFNYYSLNDLSFIGYFCEANFDFIKLFLDVSFAEQTLYNKFNDITFHDFSFDGIFIGGYYFNEYIVK